MTKAIPVSTTTLEGKRWQRSPNYRFASEKIVCPIDYTEVSKASVNMPVAFLKSEHGFHLVAIHGLLESINLYVDANGRWLADYVPLEYRLYPFLLAQTDDGRAILCIDEDSGLITESADGQPFFEDEQPSPLIKSVMETLTARHSQRLRTQQITQQLAEAGLLKEWKLEFKLNNEDKQLNGLFCADESAIASLSGEQLVALRDSSALALMYCQMLSMHQVQYLLKLLQHRHPAKAQPSVAPAELGLDGFGSDSGTLSFDHL